MSDKLILTTPCLPKSTYHCGNATSQIISDIIYRFFNTFDTTNNYYFVHDAWNLHGLPFEKMYEEISALKCYGNIRFFAEDMIKSATNEKSIFSSYNECANSHLIIYIDTDEDFIKYCVDCFFEIKNKGFISLIENEFYLDLGKFFEYYPFLEFINYIHKINIIPQYHEKSILDMYNNLNGFYPLTKSRIFSPSFVANGKSYSLNPIFQSFVYPIYISLKYRTNYPVFFQASSCGHSMLKWHYLRNVVCLIVKNDVFCENLILHGNILGIDGTPMSKHKENVIRPSDLMNTYNDKQFIKYILIKSISENDVVLQIDLARNEYQKIFDKLNIIKEGKFIVKNKEFTEKYFESAICYLKKFQIKLAFEQFYIGVKKSEILLSMGTNSAKIFKLFKIFFGDF